MFRLQTPILALLIAAGVLCWPMQADAQFCTTDPDCPGDGWEITASYYQCEGDSRVLRYDSENRTWYCNSNQCQYSVTNSQTGAEDSREDCGSSGCDGWSACSYGSQCAESGEQSRTCDDRGCSNRDCYESSNQESRGCSRDTDGQTVETCYGGPSGTQGVGECRGGTRYCRGGQPGGCENQVTPSSETCDGKDNDCDGDVDEGVGNCNPGGTPDAGASSDGGDADDGGVSSDAAPDAPVACTSQQDCPAGTRCFAAPGRCLTDLCDTIACNAGETCYQGTCYPSCSTDAECDHAANACFGQRCATNPCDGVQCAVDETCYRGACYASCAETSHCRTSQVCYRNRCSSDDCSDVHCPSGETCYRGTCFSSCDEDVECGAETSCEQGSCVPDDSPLHDASEPVGTQDAGASQTSLHGSAGCSCGPGEGGAPSGWLAGLVLLAAFSLARRRRA